MPSRTFSLGDLQLVYEAMMGIKMDKASFRRRIVEQGIVEPTGKMQTSVGHRPGELYRPSERTLQLFEHDMGAKR